MSNLQNLMAEQKNLIHYNLVKKVIQNVNARVVTQNECYFDAQNGEKSQMYKDQLKNIVVFVAGGGSYYEYECMHKLQEEMKIQIIYGSDFVFTPDGFAQELEKNNK